MLYILMPDDKLQSSKQDVQMLKENWTIAINEDC